MPGITLELSMRLLGGARLERQAQRLGELALLRDRGEDGRAPVFELANIAKPLLQRAQLRVVEVAGRLLALARDEGHGGSLAQQGDRGGDLPRLHAELGGDAAHDLGLRGRS
ncbi:MAG: hypothetical protein A3G80_08590 [Betaproteobacteria bacterium RIFCSPLOWO2_12_FULL_62_13b]|nr:MAG: hypothetical protein A3G80_08590 [Betaproteobacteria bacterium RIFCSPLOWO2_12_FULL_62_13b]